MKSEADLRYCPDHISVFIPRSYIDLLISVIKQFPMLQKKAKLEIQNECLNNKN